MSVADIQQIVIGALEGLASSTGFVLALFIGFCVVVGFTKLKKTAGGSAMVIKSLDERISHQSMVYLTPTAPRGPSDQLKAPELTERSSIG
jgi:acid phosphatase family membrane protein YuiD